MSTIKLSTFMKVMEDLGLKEGIKSTKNTRLNKGLKDDELLKELKNIRKSINNLPHSEGSGGGSCE